MQVAPLFRVDVQSPIVPLSIVPEASQDNDVGLQLAVSLSVPLSHFLFPLNVYPLLHTGLQVAPFVRVDVQSPIVPLSIVPEASQDNDGGLEPGQNCLLPKHFGILVLEHLGS